MKRLIRVITLVLIFSLLTISTAASAPAHYTIKQDKKLTASATDCFCNWSVCRQEKDFCYWEPGPAWHCPSEAPNCFYGTEYLQQGACTDTSSCYDTVSGTFVQCGSCPSGYGDRNLQKSLGATCAPDCSGADNNQCGLK